MLQDSLRGRSRPVNKYDRPVATIFSMQPIRILHVSPGRRHQSGYDLSRRLSFRPPRTTYNWCCNEIPRPVHSRSGRARLNLLSLAVAIDHDEGLAAIRVAHRLLVRTIPG